MIMMLSINPALFNKNLGILFFLVNLVEDNFKGLF
jgi:hypothetical protein